MSMSTHVYGFRPADEQWKRMKKIYDTCAEANVEIPSEVEDFFGGEEPGDKPGCEVELGKAISKYSADMQEGYEIDIAKLPKDVSIIRVVNSW